MFALPSGQLCQPSCGHVCQFGLVPVSACVVDLGMTLIGEDGVGDGI